MRLSISFAVLAWSSLLALGACEVGDTSGPAPGSVDATSGGPDGAPSLGPDAPAGAGADASASACRDPVNTQADGHHNPGQTCMSCHGPNGPGPVFSIGGTLYATANGGAPTVGATITVLDANGQIFDLVSAKNGNFWTGLPIKFPVTISASSCPTIRAMGSPAATGDCNSCHTAGGAPGTIHLP